MSTPQVFYSAELRWWGKGYLPQNITTALKRLPFTDQPPRLDQYLRQQSILSGVKWREGALEVKSMVKDPVDLPGKDNLYGPVTFWEKWRLPATLPLSGEQWLPLHKYRSVAMLGPDGNWLLQPPAVSLLQACQMEWTKVEYRGKTYWTIGLEAFASDGLSQAMQVLLDAWQGLQDRIPDLLDVLKHGERMDYPQWLKVHS